MRDHDDAVCLITMPGIRTRVLPAREALRPALVVQLGRATIRVEAGFDAELLRGVVAALSEST